ncbi:CPBP family intramembrane metalloprotease [Paenibacillus sp. GD4]|jgi:uncharacterized protein|uniref:CPBP family intramembrane glutamic endopeptidase n=1 Tax=Paenibacillus sp. GD4 TaxID=3068890 RepID=UPI002796734F|nr:CPBP family intramembrane glutamic endopeptidase [Paenibacillus sp. GD4]MDQ1912251.1 CPBP family intramembrane metalloprotease [Paenibacillus sp. GD4]
MIVLLLKEQYVWLSVWGAAALLLSVHKPLRPFLGTAICFGIGFWGYLYVTSHWGAEMHPKETRVLLNRLTLTVILIPMLVLSLAEGSPFLGYARRPVWNASVRVPLIWAGFHDSTVKLFLMIAIATNIVVFAPFLIRNGWTSIQEVWLFALLFAVVNAVLEETVWRGALLSRLAGQVGERWAVMITSLGFGLQHYSLGFSWVVCLAFALGGLFFGGVTVRSKSILPSILWHVVINLLMVFSGMIL